MSGKVFLGLALVLGGGMLACPGAGNNSAAGTTHEVELVTLATFNGANGARPTGNLALGKDGAFYGVTESGGASMGAENRIGYGTVFRVTTNGALTTLVSFNSTNGAEPMTGLARGEQGNFYGVTHSGGTEHNGVAFCISTNGEEKVLHSFGGQDGWYNGLRLTQRLQQWQGCANPVGGLLLGKDGNFYGTTAIGGFDYGAVFQMSASGELTYIFAFDGTNGEQPSAELAQDSQGNLYGTTEYGGPNGRPHGGYGTVFKINPAGQLLWYVGFNGTNGVHPNAGLTMGPAGNFYGTTSMGYYTTGRLGQMAFSCGTLFRLTTSGVLTTLVTFTNSNGAQPVGRLVLARDRNFYGATRYYNAPGIGSDEVMGNGAIFQMTPPGKLRIVAAFDHEDLNVGPEGGLTEGPDGNLYGVTGKGVFKVALRGALVKNKP